MSFHFSKSSLSLSNKADRNRGKHLTSYSVLHMRGYKHTYMYRMPHPHMHMNTPKYDNLRNQKIHMQGNGKQSTEVQKKGIRCIYFYFSVYLFLFYVCAASVWRECQILWNRRYRQFWTVLQVLETKLGFSMSAASAQILSHLSSSQQ